MGAGPGHLETFWYPFQCISVYAEPKLQGHWVDRVPGVSSGCA